MMFDLKILDKNCKDLKIFTRPNAGNGFWLSVLIPMAYMINTWKHTTSAHFEYKLSTIISFGLFLQSIEIYLKLANNRINNLLNISTKLLPGGLCSFLVWICLKQDVVFSLICGYLTCFIYNGIYIYILKSLPKSFTLGESFVVVQGFVIFIFNSLIQLPHYWRYPPITAMQNMTVILQIGLLGVTFIVAVTHFVKYVRNTSIFYSMIGLVVLIVMILPVTQDLPVFVLLGFVFDNIERILITFVYIGILGLTGAFVYWQLNRNSSSTTSIRKMFHIFVILVYLPGLIYQCTFLFVASGIILAILIVLEIARIIELYPISEILEIAVAGFIDEKDAGYVALTPLYLLIGCSLPLWIHPNPSDITGSAGFDFLALSSGVLSVGVGDTVASFVGSKYGKHKWLKSQKSVEGTLASILAQAITVILFFKIGLINFTFTKAIVAVAGVLTNSLTEALTDQVDNLVLPLVSFVILSL